MASSDLGEMRVNMSMYTNVVSSGRSCTLQSFPPANQSFIPNKLDPSGLEGSGSGYALPICCLRSDHEYS